ncbi:MAG: hypothetical protein ABIH89_02680 [Elusimicrobiota bacterium]
MKHLQSLLISAALAVLCISPSAADEKPVSFGILDASGHGVFNIGPSQGTVERVHDENLKKDVLKFGYNAPKGSVIGVWTKGYPAELGVFSVNAVNIGVNVSAPAQLKQVSVKLEIKGTKDVQEIPLRLKSGWNSIQEAIDWEKIGLLEEVVFVVIPAGSADSAAGTLDLDLAFVKAEAMQITVPAETSSSINILAAAERGVFNIGQSEGTVSRVFDETVKKDVLKFEYSVPKESMIGVWTKSFPAEIKSDTVDSVKVSVEIPDLHQVYLVSVKLEIKGSVEVQHIPLRLEPGWSTVEEVIDWKTIGELKEVVFVVSPMGGAEMVSGTLSFDLDFIKQPSSGKGGNIEKTPSLQGTPSFSILAARKKGVFNIGSSQGDVIRISDKTSGKDVLAFNYNAPRETVVGVWTKEFPSGLGADTVNTARIEIKAPDPVEARKVSVKLEIKGTKDIQNIPLRLKTGWNTIQEPIDWDIVGDLDEVVFVITPKGEGVSAKGTLFFNLDFIKLKPLEMKSAAVETASSFGILDGAERGVFNIGSSRGAVNISYDDTTGKDVLLFEYNLPKDTVVGVWTKDYPSEPGAQKVNTARIRVRMPDSGQSGRVAVNLEIKGTDDVQSIPLQLEQGWNSKDETIDWEVVGSLKEAAFVVSPEKGVESASGKLYFDLEFINKAAALKSIVSNRSLSVFGLSDASQKGVFNIGMAEGVISTAADQAIKKDIMRFDYTAPKGTLVGVWTKDYPPGLNAGAANAVNVGVNVPDPGQVQQVMVTVEIKGDKDKQVIPLKLKSGWNSIREAIHWKKIGDLDEIVFVITPVGGTEAPATLYFDIDFFNLSFIETAGGKISLVLIFSLLMSLIAVFSGKLFSSRRAVEETGQIDDKKPVPEKKGSLKWDLLYGTAAVLIAGCALLIYSLGSSVGTMNPVGVCFRFLLAGLVGAVIAELLKYRLTSKHLTPGEVFQNVMFSGLLAASSSSQVLLQAPADWAQVMMKSNITASIAFLIYHAVNASSLASARKHLRAISGGLIVGTPYFFGWLLLLENTSLLNVLGNSLTGGLLISCPAILEFLGRLIVVFGFNEAVTNGISLVTSGKPLKIPKAHLVVFLVSLGVVMSPHIADLGSTDSVAALPLLFRSIIAVLTTILAHGGLWGEVYLLTGLTLDSTQRIAPTWATISGHVTTGVKKGMVYSGILMTILYVLNILLDARTSQMLMASLPIAIGVICGAVVFPLLKTIIETFDGSQAFFDRMRYSYRNWTLYMRGAVVGFGFAHMISQGLFQQDMPDRLMFGLIMGLAASLGVSLVRDIIYSIRGTGRIQSWRLYFIDSMLGTFVGTAAAFYLDASQVPVIIEKFRLYVSAGFSPQNYTTYPLVNKWGRIDLGSYSGGVRLLFTEALAGVINWSVAAWLFAVNRAFMVAFFQKDKAPIKFLFSKEGFIDLVKHMIQVLRWGLWMSPIIFTFLRMMATPTWYNQDGAVRSLFAIYNSLTMNPEAFHAWSLKLFIWLLAFDFFRILIWIDHMGLRVATLVNLSFIGMDKLDDKIARFIGPAAAQRYIPEAIKRFTTWAPLLLPFYLPRGQAWDHAWTTSEAMQNAARGGGMLAALKSLALPQILLLAGSGILICTGVSYLLRLLRKRAVSRREKTFELQNREYKTVFMENGGGYSEALKKSCDISRRSYDTIDPCGRVLYIVDTEEDPGSPKRFWPVTGNFPKNRFTASGIEKTDNTINVINEVNGIRTTICISLPDKDAPVEIWTLSVENLTDKPRSIKVVQYLEWVLNRGLDDRFHPQYSRLFPEMEYISGLNAVFSWQKNTQLMGILASDAVPEGFLISRMDFIGRARSIWTPRIVETLDFLEARDTAAYPTFDPVGSLLLDAGVDAASSRSMRFMIGYGSSRDAAVELINRHLRPGGAGIPASKEKKSPLIGHGEILPGTPQPYYEYTEGGNKMLVHTPYTTRPYDHGMSNALGHSIIVTNRGLHTTTSGNSQQNRITPECSDTVTREIPGEAIYLYDPDNNEWYSPTHHPLNDYTAENRSEFGVDGTAVFHMTRGSISTELTVFVPPDDPVGVYLLTVKNKSDKLKRMRIAPYFQIVLALQPENSGALKVEYNKEIDAVFFENPRNTFRTGPAFSSMSLPLDLVETKRGRFFGKERGTAFPYIVEKGEPDRTQVTDQRVIAGLIGTLEIPANDECTVAIILGQTDMRKEAETVVKKYKDVEKARQSLADTKKWWLSLMGTVKVETNNTEFDMFQNWLKYQALAERIWARRGFYQASGAFGFRDQLQDTVNLVWVDPALARRQILLHASQQFIEGDVFHWFFTLTDGRTAFACRSHASDNLLWLVWGVVEYIRATGDESILDEMTSYVVSENPFQPLPKNKHGLGDLYHRSTREDSVYRHCLRSIDLVFEKRMGKHGLPLIGTGDWNDGLDEIGSEGKGESVWLGFFLHYILKDMVNIIDKKEGSGRKEYYLKKMQALEAALEETWRDDRYLRAIHDDGTEIGIKDSGVWEIDALTAAWAVKSGINMERARTVFHTALRVLERDNVILLGWPALREDTTPYLGRSSKYPEGVRENGMYCHGVQWLIKAARLLAEYFENNGDTVKADEYRGTAYRLWMKIAAISHVTPDEIEIYGGQPNKQPADLLTTYDQGRMIWNGYTGAAGWLLRQAFESVVGASLVNNELVLPSDLDKPRGGLKIKSVFRDVKTSPLKGI